MLKSQNQALSRRDPTRSAAEAASAVPRSAGHSRLARTRLQFGHTPMHRALLPVIDTPATPSRVAARTTAGSLLMYSSGIAGTMRQRGTSSASRFPIGAWILRHTSRTGLILVHDRAAE